MNEPWPRNVRAPVDCDYLSEDEVIVLPSDLVWSTRNLRWETPIVPCWHSNIASFKLNCPHHIPLARPRYTRENPPPADQFSVLLTEHEVTFGQCLQYVAGTGWIPFTDGLRALSGCNPNIIALSRRTQTPPTAEQMLPGYAIITPNPEEGYIPCVQRVWIDGRWQTIEDYFGEFSSFGTLPICQRVIGTEGYPFDVLPHTARTEVGDLIYDRDGGWLPHVMTAGHFVRDILCSRSFALARLLPEFREEGWQLVSTHLRINGPHQVLIQRDNRWQWVGTMDIPANWLTQVAYMNHEILAMRQQIIPAVGPPRRPLVNWMSGQLRAMLETDAGNDVFRGLVRRNHHLIIPREVHARGNVQEITDWLEQEYARINPEQNDNIPSVRVWTARQNILQQIAPPVRPTFPTNFQWQVNDTPPEDTVVVRFVVTERVTATDERFDRITGDLPIPRRVFDRGQDAVEQYVRENYHDGRNNDRHEGDWEHTVQDHDYEFHELQETNFTDVDEELNPEAEEDEPDPDRDETF